MDTAKIIRSGFQKLYEKIRTATDSSEEEVRVKFVESGALEALGYKGVLRDIRLERGVKGKRSDLLTFDDYQNVVFIIEFKRPNELDVDRDFAQLWDRYVKPLKAKYGVLTDGLELLIYKRINSNWERKLHVNLDAITLPQCEEVYEWLKKPRFERTKIHEVLCYFEQFDNPAERVNLSTEIAQKHFFESFELKEGSIFVNLVEKTIGLFEFELERSKFLTSAYNFWKISYAKKPEKVPENWRRIMATIGLEVNEENLYTFMFCLESAYSLFTRLILAKACEDYKLPYVEFSRFIKTEIERTSYRGDITLLAWAITTKNLIESMKQRLVKSVFEGDIFYWWEDSYKAIGAGDTLYSPRFEKQKGRFGEALADVILTLYKFDFSEIVGDPLGTLYQRYFDKETRKALGEFYTPQEVVEYILDAVDYKGKRVLGKRLLDPACGSGTFLVEALRRYLTASEQIAAEKGWSSILKELCNDFCIVGFDIHPFATFMAQMQFMLVLIPAYKRAMDEDPHFVLSRLPIFRTDSLVDETKGETRKVTLETFAEGIQYLLIDTGLPVEGGNLAIQMPYFKDVISKTDLLNVEEYFAALQAVFDTVKEAAWQGKYEVDTKELERNFKRYLEDKDWAGLVTYFTPYAEHFLQKFKELKETFGDGKLIKSLEDIMLAAVLKNYVKYDFVVGNPPYVRVQMLPYEKRSYYKSGIYDTALGQFDIYVLFIERGIRWLNERQKFGFINSNQFMFRNYGENLREFILKNSEINELIDFGDSGVFKDATNYPCIIILTKSSKPNKNIKFLAIRVAKSMENVLGDISENKNKTDFLNESYSLFVMMQSDINGKIWSLFSPKIKKILDTMSTGSMKLGDIKGQIYEGFISGSNDIYFVNVEAMEHYKIENEILKPVPKGNEVRRWGIAWNNRFVIYPYEVHNGKQLLISEDIIEEKFTNLSRYLNERKFALQMRFCVTNKGYVWYEMHDAADLRWFEQPKIVTPNLSRNNNFAIDYEGKFFLDHDCYGIILKNKERNHYLFILGLLNSKLLEFYLKQISPFASGKYYRYMTGYLNELPIKLPQNPEDQILADEITKKVDQILAQVKLEQKIEHFPEEYIKEFRNKGEEFTSLSISFNSNHKTLEPVVERTVDDQGYTIIIGKKENPIFVDSEVKADYVVAALKDKRARKNEKLQLLVPKSDAVVEAIVKELEEDEAKVTSPSVAELETEINELVYRLYGLDEEDVKVLEDFLRRF